MGRRDSGRGRLDEETPAQTWTQANLVTEIRVHASREILALCTSCSKSQCHTYTAICRKLLYFLSFWYIAFAPVLFLLVAVLEDGSYQSHFQCGRVQSQQYIVLANGPYVQSVVRMVGNCPCR